MTKYLIKKYATNKQLVGVEFEAVIIQNMTLLNLVKKIASDVEDIKFRLDKIDNRIDNLVQKNNLVE